MSSNIMNRELIAKEEQVQTPGLPLLALRGYLCFRCFLHPAKLEKCGACKRVAYCGKKCQTLDWKLQHKKHCALLKSMNDIEVKEKVTFRSRELWTASLLAKCQAVQRVTKDQVPSEIIKGQPYCTTCHRGVMEIEAPTALNPCSVCHLVFTCTSCTSSHSPNECQLFQTLADADDFLISHFEQTRQIEVKGILIPFPKSSYRALSTVSTWHQYFTGVSEKRDLDRFINSDFSLKKSYVQSLPQEESRAQLKYIHGMFRQGTVTLSMALSILVALEEGISDLPTRQSLSIFLIGASILELLSCSVFEELLHMLPALNTLKLMFIGPGCERSSGQEIDFRNCPKCQSLNRKRDGRLYHGLYHDYVKTPAYQKPDLAVLFHSGRSQAEEESWTPTTKFLVDSGTLTLCTTWTKREADEEVVELDWLGARFIRRPEENKWRALVPLLDFVDGADDTVYFHNYYRYLFQGR